MKLRKLYLITLLISLWASFPALAEDSNDINTDMQSLMSLMKRIVVPQSDIIWSASAIEIGEDGTESGGPVTEDDWRRIEQSAASLSALGFLLQMPVYSAEKEQDWISFSQLLTKVALEAETAAVNQDKDAILIAGSYLYESCSGCHQRYVK